MRVDSPNKRIVKAIDDAVAWLRRAQLSGIRVQRVSAPEVEYEFHTENFDVIVVHDPEAKPLWARHYEIETDRPVFAGRDAIKRYALNEIERERRTGTPWYGDWPRKLLERDYPAWRIKLSANSADSIP
jgi:PelA/Pel-15E family pectate lyase